MNSLLTTLLTQKHGTATMSTIREIPSCSADSMRDFNASPMNRRTPHPRQCSAAHTHATTHAGRQYEPSGLSNRIAQSSVARVIKAHTHSATSLPGYTRRRSDMRPRPPSAPHSECLAESNSAELLQNASGTPHEGQQAYVQIVPLGTSLLSCQSAMDESAMDAAGAAATARTPAPREHRANGARQQQHYRGRVRADRDVRVWARAVPTVRGGNF